MSLKIDQRGASARGDIVGQDKYEQHYHPAAAPAGIVEKLLKKLQDEVANNQNVQETIEALEHFHDSWR